MKWKRFFETDVMAQQAIILMFILGGMLLVAPSIFTENKSSVLFTGLFMTTASLNLAAWYLAPQRKEKKETYEDILRLAEKPKGRWDRK